MSPPNESLNVLGQCRVCGGSVVSTHPGKFECESCGLLYAKVPPAPVNRRGYAEGAAEDRLNQIERDVASLQNASENP